MKSGKESTFNNNDNNNNNNKSILYHLQILDEKYDNATTSADLSEYPC